MLAAVPQSHDLRTARAGFPVPCGKLRPLALKKGAVKRDGRNEFSPSDSNGNMSSVNFRVGQLFDEYRKPHDPLPTPSGMERACATKVNCRRIGYAGLTACVRGENPENPCLSVFNRRAGSFPSDAQEAA